MAKDRMEEYAERQHSLVLSQLKFWGRDYLLNLKMARYGSLSLEEMESAQLLEHWLDNLEVFQ